MIVISAKAGIQKQTSIAVLANPPHPARGTHPNLPQNQGQESLEISIIPLREREW